jgi:hypothetical protein
MNSSRDPGRSAPAAADTSTVTVHRGDERRSAPTCGGNGPQALVPYWLGAVDRELLAEIVRVALRSVPVHPVAAIHLADVATELHVATARDAVWPAPAARVRRATGWDDDVLPVRLSSAERASLLALDELPDGLRGQLSGGTGQ